VRVTDANGSPVSNVDVRFSIVSGAGVVAPARLRTDSAGEAAALWRLGSTAGPQRVAALAPDVDSEILTFTATALADVAAATPVAGPRTEAAANRAAADTPDATPPLEPIYVVPQSFAVGGNFVCAIPGGDLSCRGANDRGQRASRPGAAFTALTAGLAHACGVTAAGEVSCWGANESGQLGDDSHSDRGGPAALSTDLHFSTVVAGASHTCGLAAGGRAMCWGKNLNGQLGDGTREDRTTPRRASTGQRFVRLVAGWSHTCGRSAGGETLCWGLNDHGQLGDGSRVDRLTPTRVSGTFESLVAGSAHTCGIRTGQVFCWGDNSFGQLGDGTTEDRTVPTPVQGLPGTPAHLAAGAVSTCALLADGTAYCWGQNIHGQLGDGSTVNRAQPSPVAGNHAFRSIFAGGALTCGFADDGLDYCWGLNQSGQLGDGTRASRSVPTRVGG
jgi:alpha-tubulin suppressor-like RCC1 family protein